MAGRRKRKVRRNAIVATVVVVAAIGYVMLSWDGSAPDGDKDHAATLTARPANEAPVPDIPEAGSVVAERGRITMPAERPESEEDRSAKSLKAYQLARQSDAQNELIEARIRYTQALKIGLPLAQLEATRARLVELADEMLFDPKKQAGDSLVSNYVVQAGDTLDKIAKQYKVTAELIARVNGLKSKNMIRVGQNLKVLNGPFHAEILKGQFLMHVYLQDTLVRQFQVGLGDDGSTPSGEWLINSKLVNPTYFSPRGEGVISADDPENPLGERWIGLEGVQGEAVGQERYGIHGTNDPATIGKNESLGCVRMYNEDVGRLYDMLVVEHSRVRISD